MADDRVLRIGVIQGIAVIEERIVRTKGPVSFGTAPGNTFVLQGSDLPKTVTLFDVKGDAVQVVFGDDTLGRLDTAEQKVELSQLKSKAERAGDKYRLTIDPSARGRVKLSSEITVLFHFVPAPPAATSTALPADLRTSVIAAIEPVFTAVMLASFLLHSAIAIFVKVVEPPAPADSLEDLRRVVENLAPPPKVDVPKVPINIDTKVNTGPGKGDDEPVPSGDTGGGGDEASTKKGKGGGGGVGDRAALREQIAGRGILQLIGGRGGPGSGGGAVGSVFGAGSAISDDLGSALAGTSGVGVAGGSGGGVTRRGEGGDGTGGGCGGAGGGAADIGMLASSGGGKVDTGSKSAARIVARVRADDIEAVDGKIDRKVVKATLMRRSDAFQSCYEGALKANSKLAGKLVVEFTIGNGGKVTDARVVKDGLGSGAVAQCVLEVLRRLRFPAPDDGEVTIANTFVFQPGG